MSVRFYRQNVHVPNGWASNYFDEATTSGPQDYGNGPLTDLHDYSASTFSNRLVCKVTLWGHADIEYGVTYNNSLRMSHTFDGYGACSGTFFGVATDPGDRTVGEYTTNQQGMVRRLVRKDAAGNILDLESHFSQQVFYFTMDERAGEWMGNPQLRNTALLRQAAAYAKLNFWDDLNLSLMSL
jgi:catechol 2,3-dioxygenase-like lactoylglutathione lyase family enzyme